MHTFAVIGFIWFALVFLLISMVYFWPLSIQRFLSRRRLSKFARKRVLAGAKGKLTYFEGGHGPTVVLLHGAGDQAGNWSHLAQELVEDYRLIIPDLPGHGGTPFPGNALTLGDVFGGLEDVMDHTIGDGQAFLMGNSMGGWMALLYALRYPDRVKGLILEDSGGIRKDTPTPNLVPETIDEARELLEATRGPDDPETPKFVLRHMIELVKKGPIAKLSRSDGEPYYLDDRLSALHVPVVILWGSDDGLLPPEYGKALAEKISQATFHFIPRCGHIPHLEKPREVIPIVREFLEKHYAADGGTYD